MPHIIGIDPGVSGAIAILTHELELKHVYDMPTVELAVGKGKRRWVDQFRLAVLLVGEKEASHAFIEDITPRAPDGRLAIAVLFHSIGVVDGVLATLGIPTTSIAPRVWQAGLRVPKGKDGSLLRASELMPKGAQSWFTKGEHGRSDAALIAYWGVRSLQAIAAG